MNQKTTRKCKNCKEEFTPSMPLQTSCSYHCALVVADEKVKKKQPEQFTYNEKRIQKH